MENIKLSFIVPVYNVAPYLRKCLDSLLAQDYSDYEIILVDDGSTDNSGAICDEYALKSQESRVKSQEYPLIQVVHRENGGLSAARNAGLKIAKGEYICFVDSDDYWELNVLGRLMTQIERDKLDVLRFKYKNVDERYEVFQPYKRDHRLDNDYSKEPTDGITFLNTRMNTQCYAVMFVIRRSLLIVESGRCNVEREDCLFTEGIYFEDTDWMPRMLIRAKRVASTATIVYNYLVRKGSITNAINQVKQKKVLDDKMRLIGVLQQQAKELEQKGLSKVWYGLMIADAVISIIDMLAVDFYSERKDYINQLQTMNLFPIVAKSFKARIVNISPQLVVRLIHYKNY